MNISLCHKVNDAYLMSARRKNKPILQDQADAVETEILPDNVLQDAGILEELLNTDRRAAIGCDEINPNLFLPSQASAISSSTESNESITSDETDIYSHFISTESTQKRWLKKTICDTEHMISKASELKKLTVNELGIIFNLAVSNKTPVLLKKWKNSNKAMKVNTLSSVIGDGSVILNYVKTLKSLKQICYENLMRHNIILKETLNAVHSTLLYKKRKQEWMTRSPYQNGQVIVGLKDEISWFSHPGYSDELKQLEPKCLDGEHLLVNARVKVCKDGMLGLQKEAWHQVAEVYPDVISKSLVVDLINKQSAANANHTFSVKVEEAMTELGYENEAEFCRLIRHWYSAEGDPGIPALQHVRYRLDFKNFLLRDVDFGRFLLMEVTLKGCQKGCLKDSFRVSIHTYSCMHCARMEPLIRGPSHCLSTKPSLGSLQK